MMEGYAIGVTNAIKLARHGCFAQFPGTGPESTCRECTHFHDAALGKRRCAEYARLV